MGKKNLLSIADLTADEILEILHTAVELKCNLKQGNVKPILAGKERVGAKVRKRYDIAQTPYQRLLAFGILGEDKRRELERLFNSLNPVKLRAQIEARQRETNSCW